MNVKRSIQTLVIKLSIAAALLILIPYSIRKYRLDVIFTYEVIDLSFSGKDTLPYRLFEPLDNNPQKKYPLLVYLHGAGSRGTDNKRHLKMIRDFMLDSSVKKEYPCYILAPQCMNNPYQWSDMRKGVLSSPLEKVEALTEELILQHNIDTNRIYLLGFSMGAAGAWESMIYHPDRYAAAVVMSGWSYPDQAAKIKHIPVWAFHGAKDNTVKPVSIRKMVNELKKLNAPIRYTEYPKVWHSSYKTALKEPELLPWLFSQAKQKGLQSADSLKYH